MTKRIAFFLGSMGRGGAERVISILSNDYAASQWNTDIALLLLNNVDYTLDKSTRIIDLTGKCKNRLLRLPMWLKGIRNYIKKNKPDVIVSFAARINVLVILASLGLNVKIVVSERNDPMHDGRGFVTRILTKFLYPKVEKVVFQTERVKKQFNNRIQENSIVIPNPISVPCVLNEKKEKKIVSAGRLTKQKNQEMLINAFSKAVKKHPEYKLYIYGEGELRHKLSEKINELGIADKIFLPGNILDLHKEISDSEIFVLSSDYEGLSNALLEAMMMGFACISTDCAGADEYIKTGENGIVVPVGNEAEMEKAILFMMENDEKRINMGLAAKESAKSFCSENVLKIWHSVID